MIESTIKLLILETIVSQYWTHALALAKLNSWKTTNEYNQSQKNGVAIEINKKTEHICTKQQN